MEYTREANTRDNIFGPLINAYESENTRLKIDCKVERGDQGIQQLFHIIQEMV